jgi:putative ABC transport system permease protein
MASIGQDLRYALRRMKATPGFTAAAVATLALGLGVNSAVLSLAHAIFLKPLPLQEASRLVLVEQTVPSRPSTFAFPLSYPDYLYFRDHARTFEALAAHYPTSPLYVVTPDGGFTVSGSVVTASYFAVLRLQPAFGRFFTADEDRVPGRTPVVILGHDLWRSRFGGDPGILGRTVRINGTAFAVVGIAPEGFNGVLRGVSPVQVWIPTAMFHVGYRYCDGFARDCRVLNLVGRLRDQASIQDAQSDLTLLARQLETAFPDTNKGRGVVVRPARGIRIDEQTKNRPIVGLIAAAAALVLLVASANVAGLLLARGLRRRKEIAIRFALGATRLRVMRLLLVESAMVAAAGGAAGLILAVWSTDFARSYFSGSGEGGATNFDLSLDVRVIAAALGIALVTGLVTGIAPALRTTRSGPLPALKDTGAATQRGSLREGLIVMQVAVSVLLLAVSGLVVRSFLDVHRGPGYDPDRVIVLRLRPSLVGYSAERAWAFQREVIRRIEEISGVTAASPANIPPLPGWVVANAPVQLPGDSSDPATPFRVATTHVGPRYFETLGVQMIEGREFDDRDRAGGPRVAIVNEAFVRHFWPRERAAGNVAVIEGEPTEIVGVAPNIQYVSALQQPDPMAYLNFWQQDTGDNWSLDSRTHIRVAGDAAAMLPQIQRTIAAVDPDVPVSEVLPLGARLDIAFSDVRAARAFFVIFGVLALVLSVIGLYGALAFAVGQRTREIAIRVALGAARLDVGRLVVRRGIIIVLLGAGSGLVAAVIAGPLLAHLLYGVRPRDPLTLAAGPAILALISLVAMWLPARRAMRLEPMAALRSE